METQTVTWRLPASKMDVQGFAVSRSWGCLCAAETMVTHFCPYHTAIEHKEMIGKWFGPDHSGPLFPNSRGGACAKQA
eukprot:1452416-Amphidinium_carterae.1